MMGRSATDPALSSKIPTFAGLIFKVYDNAGASREYSTRDFNLVPLNPLHVNAFEEKYETMDFPSYHGTPEKAGKESVPELDRELGLLLRGGRRTTFQLG